MRFVKAIYSRFQVYTGEQGWDYEIQARIQLNNLTGQARGAGAAFSCADPDPDTSRCLNAEPGPEPDPKLEPDTDTGPDPACPNLGNNDRLVIGSGIGSTILTHK